MIQALRAEDSPLYDTNAEMPPGLWLNMNDSFGYATADAEEITFDDIPTVYALWRTFGWEGVVWWVWQRRKQAPIAEVQQAIAARFWQ